jgi:hypothetical protein
MGVDNKNPAQILKIVHSANSNLHLKIFAGLIKKDQPDFHQKYA